MDMPPDGEAGGAESRADAPSTPAAVDAAEAVGESNGRAAHEAPDAPASLAPSDGSSPNGNGGENAQARSEQGFNRHERNGRRHRRNRGRGRGRDNREPRPDARGEPRADIREPQIQAPVVLTPAGEQTGWFDPERDGGFLRRPEASYLAEPGDAFVPTHIVRQFAPAPRRRHAGLRARPRSPRPADGRWTFSHDQRRRSRDQPPAAPTFSALTASYPERKLTPRDRPPGQGRPGTDAARIDLDRADRLRTARPDRRAGPRRQDDAAPRDHRRRGDQPPRTPCCSSCSSTNVPRKSAR